MKHRQAGSAPAESAPALDGGGPFERCGVQPSPQAAAAAGGGGGWPSRICAAPMPGREPAWSGAEPPIAAPAGCVRLRADSRSIAAVATATALWERGRFGLAAVERCNGWRCGGTGDADGCGQGGSLAGRTDVVQSVGASRVELSRESDEVMLLEWISLLEQPHVPRDSRVMFARLLNAFDSIERHSERNWDFAGAEGVSITDSWDNKKNFSR